MIIGKGGSASAVMVDDTVRQGLKLADIALSCVSLIQPMGAFAVTANEAVP